MTTRDDLNTRDRTHQSRLAAPTRTQQARDRLTSHPQRNAIEHRPLPANDTETLDFDHRINHEAHKLPLTPRAQSPL